MLASGIVAAHVRSASGRRARPSAVCALDRGPHADAALGLVRHDPVAGPRVRGIERGLAVESARQRLNRSNAPMTSGVPTWFAPFGSGGTAHRHRLRVLEASAGLRKISSVGAARWSAALTAPLPPCAVRTFSTSGPKMYGDVELDLHDLGRAGSMPCRRSRRPSLAPRRTRRGRRRADPSGTRALMRSASPSINAVSAPLDAVSESAAAPAQLPEVEVLVLEHVGQLVRERRLPLDVQRARCRGSRSPARPGRRTRARRPGSPCRTTSRGRSGRRSDPNARAACTD